jgi:hypothetical protein
MFHAFQAEQGEKRAPNEIKAMAIPVMKENIVRKYRENQQLIFCFESNDANDFEVF